MHKIHGNILEVGLQMNVRKNQPSWFCTPFASKELARPGSKFPEELTSEEAIFRQLSLQCLRLSDVLSFTRRPMFFIIESESSSSFLVSRLGSNF